MIFSKTEKTLSLKNIYNRNTIKHTFKFNMTFHAYLFNLIKNIYKIA